MDVPRSPVCQKTRLLGLRQQSRAPTAPATLNRNSNRSLDPKEEEAKKKKKGGKEAEEAGTKKKKGKAAGADGADQGSPEKRGSKTPAFRGRCR